MIKKIFIDGVAPLFRRLEKYECKNLEDAFADLIFNDLVRFEEKWATC